MPIHVKLTPEQFYCGACRRCSGRYGKSPTFFFNLSIGGKTFCLGGLCVKCLEHGFEISSSIDLEPGLQSTDEEKEDVCPCT